MRLNDDYSAIASMAYGHSLLAICCLLLFLYCPGRLLALDALHFPPPDVDYATICTKTTNSTATVKNDKNKPFKQKLLLAQKLIDGDAETLPDVTRAVEILEDIIDNAPEFAVVKAKLMLARILLYGIAMPQDTPRAVALLKDVISVKPYTAGAYLGLYHEMQERYAQAAQYYKQAAAAGNPGAYLRLSYLYRETLVIPPSDDAADEMLTLAQNKFLEQLAKGQCNALVSIAMVLTSRNYATRNEALAAKWLEAASEAGQVRAMARLADMYDQGVFIEHNPDMALKLWQKAAEGGNAAAMYQLASYALRNGKISDAKELFRKAAERGHRPSIKKLIKLYMRHSQDIDADYKQAAYWLKRAVKMPDPEAELLFLLAEIFAHGKGVQTDIVQAFTYYELAAKSGSIKALVKLGDAYKYGKGVNIDPIKSYRFYRLAANHGNGDAMKRLIENYECGVAREASDKWADLWRERAVYKQNWSVIKEKIKTILRSAEGQLSPELVNILRKRISQKQDRIAMVLLAVAYEQGNGVEQDSEQSSYWQKKAIARGSKQEEGLIALAEAVLDTDMLAGDIGYAQKLLQQAMQQQSAKAAYKLGQLYGSHKMGKPADILSAQEAYQFAVQLGHAGAMHKLASILLKQPDAKKQQQAVKLLEQSAAKNQVEAMLKLANYYINKNSTSQDDIEHAEYWLQLAKAHFPCKEKQRKQLQQIELLLAQYKTK